MSRKNNFLKKSLCVALSLMMTGGALTVPGIIACENEVQAFDMDKREGAPNYKLADHSQQDIIDYLIDHPFELDKNTVYSKNYSTKAPYAPGDVSSADRQQALNALNFCRYIAGLPADVGLKASYNEGTQIGCLVNAANDTLTHAPSKPAGMSDEMFKKQLNGESNIHWGYGYADDSIASHILDFVNDSDSYNISEVGHRMWCLDPLMKYTGFGRVGYYSSMYSFDDSRNANFTGEYIAWPAKNTPYELYRSVTGEKTAFSVAFSTEYMFSEKEKVKVVAKSQKTGKTWTITEDKHLYKEDSSDGLYLSKNSNNFFHYGSMGPYIVYSLPDLPANDKISVTITGLEKNGAKKTFNYSVQFFTVCRSKLDRTGLNLGKGESYQLRLSSASMHSYDKDKAVSWSTSNSSVASVSGGKVTAKNKGTAVITCKTKLGRTLKCSVTVKNAPTKLNLNKYQIKLGAGETFKLNSWINNGAASDKRAFASSDNSICHTDGKGLLTAKKPGTAKITVKTYNGKTAVCTVTVCKKLTKLNLNANRIVIGVGEGFKLNSWVNEGEASYKRSFSSYTSNVVAYVSGTGYIVGKRPGSDIITVKGYNGVKAECVVIVKKAPDKLNLNKYQLTLKQGQYFHLNSWITEGTASYKRAFSSSNNSICYTNGRGDLKGIKKGTAVITVKTYNGVKAQCKVTVV